MTISAAVPETLADIAGSAGLSQADTAFLAEVDESTVSRLWADPDWPRRASGATLDQLAASIAGVAEYLMARPFASRMPTLASALAGEGLDVDETAVSACQAAGVPLPYIVNALRAALHTVRGEDTEAAAYLARFWGRDQDRALEHLFGRGEGRLLAEPAALVSASAGLAERLQGSAHAFHPTLATAVLAHHTRREVPDPPQLTSVGDRRDAIRLRSTVMGRLIGHNDYDLAAGYGHLTDSCPVVALIEDWSFPTYARDVHPEPGFALPRALLLRNTAAEVVREVGEYSGAYVQYVVSVYLPRALARDPTFGLAAGQLAAAIRQRLDEDDDPALRAACNRALRTLGDPS
jgi:hypothetical protein